MKGLLLALFLPAFCIGQSAKDSVISFIGIISVDSIKKEDLFIRARQWFNASFKDARNVIRIADKETGELLAKGRINSYHWYRSLGTEAKIPVEYDFDLNIYLKDGRYKYIFTNFITPVSSLAEYDGPLLYTPSYPTKGYRKKEIMDKIWVSQREELSVTVEKLIMGLKAFMSNPTNDF